MKGLNLKNALLVTIMVMCSFFAIANVENSIDPSDLKVKSSKETVIVLLNALNTEETELTLTDEMGEVLYSKKLVGKIDYSLGLDLTNLKAGKYALEVNRSSKTFYQTITITENNEILLPEMELELKPVVTKNTNSFSVSNPNGIVKSVNMTDERGELVYTKKYNQEVSKSTKNIRYNLEQVNPGTYYISVETIFNTEYYAKVVVK